MGGDCLNTGCVPSKALLRTAKFVQQMRHARDLGVRSVSFELDFADAMERVQRIVKTIEPHDSVERFTGLGVDCVKGHARIASPFEVDVDGQRLSTRSIIIAAGGRPLVPTVPGIEDVGYLTSETVWDLREQPGTLLLLGGGPIGCELAQAFQRLGSRVVLVEMLDGLVQYQVDL